MAAAAATLTFHDTWRPRANPWAIALTVTMATFMEALDSSIANVAMQHIAGTLSATQDEATWVLTSYLVANAMVLPISGWIANRIGRKRFYMSCVFLFTVCSFLCGIAPTLGILVFFRVLQGAAGGGLQPSEQAILADTFRPEKRSMAFAVYGVAVVMAPAIGPTVGGWIIDNYSWRWIFFLNIPVGILSMYLSNRMVEDPPYLAEVRKKREGIDTWGLGLLIVAIGALQIMLDKGQEDDWFSSHFIVSCAVIGGVAFAAFVYREFHVEHPVLDLRLYMRRNVGMTQLVLFMVGLSLYTSTVFIPLFLQEIMGYTARQAGMAVSSGAIVLLFLFPLAGMFAPKFDPRKLVAIGFIITTVGLIRMANLNLEVSFWQAVSWRAFIALGLPFLFIPINILCYAGIPQHKNNEISGMSALSRNLGGSVGISFMTTMLARLTQRHLAFLGEHASPGNRPFEAMRSGIAGALQQRTGMAQPDAIYHAGAQIYAMAQRQARLLAYVDVIWVFVIITVVLVPMPFLMHRPKKAARTAIAH
ncbi:MAG TPA: DHA2 family efflux MFS transporter permease subunit [Terracidiphilus sp.]|nr:DHA2 family efflux MFS transporter permease subunit [Terracidiphilus sp.]